MSDQVGRQEEGGPGRARPGPPLLWAGAGALVVLAVLGALWAAVRPQLARRQALAEVRRHALPERRIEDASIGLVAELPAGWYALRAQNPLLPAPGAQLRLAQPALEAFATVSVAVRPRLMDALDAHLDELLQRRLPLEPSLRQRERADVQLGRGRGRLVRTSWTDGRTAIKGATVAWADGYDVFSLEAWAKEPAVDFETQLDALCRGLMATGVVGVRLREAVERLALEVPELPEDALRLLVAERMSEGKSVDEVPREALRRVSRGLPGLTAAETEEMARIYRGVWAPVPDLQRARLGSLLRSIQAGREVPAAEVQALRQALKAGVLALPTADRVRLRELSARALSKASP